MLKGEARWGYWCECWTEKLTDEGALVLRASFDAYTAPQAAEASEQASQWLYDGRIDTRRALLRSEPCTVSVTHTTTRITWTIRPVIFLPLAHRQGCELPACAYDFKPRPEPSTGVDPD
ncbi:hypothetical protein RM704_27440 [Streptomyces sp. DSM 3412]|uniref:Uncharacterized protein n=1 Tax=Streptomyces gottesmaniae TaxID=3075518 RepID=A0ABU2Z681_9ACTN|nr:hypothetical protein [Streptomyces sp. DSM 3412]MDT0571154.1 hypothetical protein [Streptomyces sp. DSM 3412]